ADQTGRFRGMSANYSGAGFADMYFNVNTVPAEEFAQWVAATRTTGPVLDAQNYAELAKPSQAVKPFSYRIVAPDLCSGILSGSHTPLQAGDDPFCGGALALQKAEK